MSTHRYFILNKPFGMVSQFVSSHPVPLLSHLPHAFPEGIHAIGRLDAASEGLLILTTNKKVTRLLFQGTQPHTRTYVVQVKGFVEEETIAQLETGITIRIRGGENWITSPCKASIIDTPDYSFTRKEDDNPLIPQTWLSITLTEGKYHQVRKMVAAVRHRCRRLIRTSIEDLQIRSLEPGAVQELAEEQFFDLLKIKDWR